MLSFLWFTSSYVFVADDVAAIVVVDVSLSDNQGEWAISLRLYVNHNNYADLFSIDLKIMLTIVVII